VQSRDYKGIISGHLKEPVITDYRPALEAYSRQFDIRDDLVHMAIADGAKTIDRITMTPIVYPSLTNPVFLYFEKWMIEHHVKDLIAKNLVEEHRDQLRAT
jgi:hypothetical protein